MSVFIRKKTTILMTAILVTSLTLLGAAGTASAVTSAVDQYTEQMPTPGGEKPYTPRVVQPGPQERLAPTANQPGRSQAATSAIDDPGVAATAGGSSAHRAMENQEAGHQSAGQQNAHAAKPEAASLARPMIDPAATLQNRNGMGWLFPMAIIGITGVIVGFSFGRKRHGRVEATH